MSRGVLLVVLFVAAVLSLGFWAQEHYLLTAISVPIAAPSTQASSLDSKVAASIQERIQKSGADVGLDFRTLDGRTAWSFHAEDTFHAASTMKIPVMIELFHQVQQGKLKLDDSLPIKNEFHSLADGSIFTLDPKDDSETDLYQGGGPDADAVTALRADDYGEQQLRDEPVDPEAGGGKYSRDGSFFARGWHERAARGRGQQSICKRVEQFNDRAGSRRCCLKP